MRTDTARPAPVPVPRADHPPTFTGALTARDVPLGALDALVDRTTVPVLLADRDGHVAYANAAARRMDAERLEPLRWAVTRALLTEDATREGPITTRAVDGSVRWLELHVVPVRDADARIAGAVVTVADVTARQRLADWKPVMDALIDL